MGSKESEMSHMANAQVEADIRISSGNASLIPEKNRKAIPRGGELLC